MTDAGYHTIAVEHRGAAAWITLSRPDELNAITLAMVDELHDLLDRLYHDPAVRVVVLRGAGNAFCAGLDIRESVGGAHRDAARFSGGYGFQGRLADICTKLRRVPQPIVALLHGAAVGGGLALALASDVRVCTPAARFAVGTIRMGLAAGDMGISYFLPRLVGLSVASELMLTGRTIDARRAQAIGLVSDVVANDTLEYAGMALVADMLRATPIGLRLTKEGLALAVDAPSLDAALAIENRSQLLAGRSEDFAEARHAFLDKRPPMFKGR